MTSIMCINSLNDIPAEERNLGLVVEVPRIGCKASYLRAANPEVALNHTRWHFVSNIHIIMPNTPQLYLCCTLRYKHYHSDKDALTNSIKTCDINSLENRNEAKDGNTPVAQVALHIHLPTENVSLPFVKVINLNFD